MTTPPPFNHAGFCRGGGESEIVPFNHAGSGSEAAVEGAVFDRDFSAAVMRKSHHQSLWLEIL
ncbi:MAG: hypothetical protein AB1757_09085 [Acidobacteriota bacterium]